MKWVGVGDFRDHATQYLASDEVLAIERHGQPIGFYVPTGKSRQETFQQALARLQETVQQVLAETGMSHEELAQLLDLKEPLPEGPEVAADAYAAGR